MAIFAEIDGNLEKETLAVYVTLKTIKILHIHENPSTPRVLFFALLLALMLV